MHKLIALKSKIEILELFKNSDDDWHSGREFFKEHYNNYSKYYLPYKLSHS